MSVHDIRGLIFDLDGVIADTDDMHYRTWQRLADEEGVPFSREKYLKMSGVGHQQNARLFTEGLNLSQATIKEWMARKQRYYVELRDTIQPDDVMAGIPRLIREAKADGLKIGVGSSSRNAKPVLKQLHLIDEFEIIGDGYTVKNLKPAPDIFVWVAGGLGLKPSQCLVLEDAVGGVEAALAGGFYVVGIGDAPLEMAHAQISSLANIALKDLLQLLAY